MDFTYTINVLLQRINAIESSIAMIYNSRGASKKIEELEKAINYLKNVEPSSSLPVKKQVENLFMWNSDYLFEAGMDSCFRRDILKLLQEEPIDTLKTIHTLVRENKDSVNVLSEILTIIGDETTSETHEVIFEILSVGLQNPSHYVRDSAGLGFSSLGDKKAIPLLEEAIRAETSEMMKRDLQQVIDYL